jgi:hypothetical protein
MLTHYTEVQLTRLWHYYVSLDSNEASRIANRLADILTTRAAYQRLHELMMAFEEVV